MAESPSQFIPPVISRISEYERKSIRRIHESTVRVKGAPSKRVIVNNPEANEDKGFASNNITTSKYTWWNFLPIFLWENLNPFNKFANFYFVCVAICECIPQITITNGKPESITSLLFVLFVEAITSIREDYARHKADKKANSTPVEVLNREKEEFEEKPQGLVRVGDIVRVKEGSIFPADMIFLRSTDPKAPKSCWVNTKSLDGETDNKFRKALKVTSEQNGVVVDGTATEFSELRAIVSCELPNNMTNDFNGNITVRQMNKYNQMVDVNESINIQNILLRGCVLKNTEGVIGAVISTGTDTKVEYGVEKKKWWSVKSSNQKTAMLTRRINQVLYCLVAALIVLCVIGALGENVISTMIIRHSWYIPITSDIIIKFGLSFFRFFLLCYQFIPVSLYVTLSLIYSFQQAVMENDLQLYDEINDEPMRVRTSTLNDDLGQVGYIFTDKTGTLTANLMQFRKCIVDGVSYGVGESDIGRLAKNEAKELEVVVEKSTPRAGIYRYNNYEDGSDSHPGRTLKADLQSNDTHAEQLRLFFLHMAINHTVIVEKKENGTIELSASSPDEQAFVAGSFCQGVEFLGLDYETNRIKVNMLGSIMEIHVLHIIPYESSRKRMSMIVEMPNGEILLLCKGADSVLLELQDSSLNSVSLTESLICQVAAWAEEAFRTMVFGYKTLDREYLYHWLEEYDKVKDDPVQKAYRKQKKPNRIDEMEYELESGLLLQGASAIEDSLQEGVPETLAKLSSAGIHIWMITGDKVGTAKNIAVACNLLKSDMKMIEFTKETVDRTLVSKGAAVKDLTEKISPTLIQEIEWKILEAERNGDVKQSDTLLGDLERDHPGLLATRLHCETMAAKLLDHSNQELLETSMALVVDELFIDYLILSCRQAFLVVAQACKVVIACRARKDQKAKLTRLVRHGNTEVVTLAIGDGANDVEMIRAAHIGVGIIGKEGTQAVNNADYAIGQFRFLTRMLLVYGHRWYRGITLASLLIFYKNVLFTLIQYLYTFVCGLSGTRNQSYIAILWYNTLLTAFGPLLLAFMDRDLTDRNYLRFPQLHREGVDHRHFSVKRFLIYLVKAILEAMLIFCVLFFGMYTMDMPSGTVDVWIFGMVTVTVNIFIVNLSASIEQSVMYLVTVVIFWAEFICWIALVISNSYSLEMYSDYYHAFTLIFGNPVCWLVMVLAVMIAILPTMIVKALKRECRPTLSQFIQDVQVRDVKPEVIKKALECMEENRSIDLELKTIRDVPATPMVPEVMSTAEEQKDGIDGDNIGEMRCDQWKEEDEINEENNEDDMMRTMELPPSYSNHLQSLTESDRYPAPMLLHTARKQASIRSMAGFRALALCNKLHGPSYDCQSVDEQTQDELISKINSHNWRAPRPDTMDAFKAPLMKVNDAIHQLSSSLSNEIGLGKLFTSKFSLHTVKEVEEEEEEEEEKMEESESEGVEEKGGKTEEMLLAEKTVDVEKEEELSFNQVDGKGPSSE